MVTVQANAKLNLRLKITGRRDDGYHLLEMINVPVSIYDEIGIAFSRGRSRGLVQLFSREIGCPPEKTTIHKAFRLIENELPADAAIEIQVQKNIPAGSGMGGGSSDAAVFLRMVMDHYGIRPRRSFIDEVAGKVGADVPFFMVNRPAVLRGIGERIEALDNFPALLFTVIVPDFAISTAWAYSEARKRLTKSGTDINVKPSGWDFEELTGIMENDLEKIAIEAYPEIETVKRFLTGAGAAGAMMTGSGSAVFGVFCDQEKRDAACALAQKAFPGYCIFGCHSVGA